MTRQVAVMTLIHHPAAPLFWVRTFTVALHYHANGDLEFSYRLYGDLTHLFLPPQVIPDRADRLWQQTCCELFIATVGEPSYREFNFSPSGQWQVYGFSDYRSNAIPIAATAPDLCCHYSDKVFTLDGRIAAADLPSGIRHFGLTAVIADCQGGLSYWALAHQPGLPDFHRKDTWIEDCV